MARRTIGDRMDNAEEDFRGMTVGKFIFRVVAGAIVLGLIISVFGFFAGWFNTAKDVVSPQNVKAQYEFAYTYDQSLGSIARQYCNSKVNETKITGDNLPQVQMQTSAYYNNYTRVAGEYTAALQNAFKAKYVKPADVPQTAPTIEQKVAQLRADEGLKCGDVGDGVTPPTEVPASPGN